MGKLYDCNVADEIAGIGCYIGAGVVLVAGTYVVGTTEVGTSCAVVLAGKVSSRNAKY